MSCRLIYRGRFDTTADAAAFAAARERVCIETVEPGFMTRDVPVLISSDHPWMNTYAFQAEPVGSSNRFWRSAWRLVRGYARRKPLASVSDPAPARVRAGRRAAERYLGVWLLAIKGAIPSAARLACLLVAILAWSSAGQAETGALRATLPNGLRVVVVPNHLAPVITTELTYLAGSNDAPTGFPGTAHALEHMMFRGSEGLDRDQLAELGARLGGAYNAHTTETVTTYTQTVPAADLGLVLRSEALRMRGLSLREADWTQERGAIEQEVARTLSNPFFLYQSQLQAILFAGTPYQHTALGTRESFEDTGIGVLRDFYRRWYAPNNAVLVIAGDIVPEEALADVKAALGDIPARDVPEHASVTAAAVQAQTLALPTNFSVGLISLGYRFPGLKTADFAAADILSDVLASQRGPLYALVPAGQALMAHFSYRAMPDAGMGMVLAAFPVGSDPAPLLAAVREVIATIARDGAPPALVEAAKRQELAQLASRGDSISEVASAWTHALTQADAESPDDVADAYRAVTAEDVGRLARRLLDPAQAVTAILTPSPTGQPAGNAAFGVPESFQRAPEKPVVLPAWAEEGLARLIVPDSKVAPEVSVLPNGLKLIVLSVPDSRTVTVSGRVRQGTETEEPPGQEGIAGLVARMYEFGSVRLDRLALREAVDALAASESAGPRFRLHLPASEFEAGMRLLAEHQLHPAFPEAAFPIVRQQMEQGVSGRLPTPDYRFNRAVLTAIVPEGDPTLRQATPESLRALTYPDLLAYHAAAYRPDLTTIVVVGRVTAEQARQVVADTFGGWQAVGVAPQIDLPPIGPKPATETYVGDPSSQQTQVALAQAVAFRVSDPDRFPLVLGNAILGDGFSSRLYRDLRVNTGYVYTVTSALRWSRTRTTYLVEFGADADKVEQARSLVLRNLREMQTQPVSESDLSRTKAEMLRRLPMQRASLRGIAGTYLYLDDLGLPLETEAVLAQRYLSVTAADIQRVFAAVMRPDDLATVVKGPAR